MCTSAEAAAIRSAGLRERSEHQTVLSKHRLSPVQPASRTSRTQTASEGVLVNPFWGSSLQWRRERVHHLQVLSGAPADLLLFSAPSGVSFKKICHLLMPNLLSFLKTLIWRLAQKPQACKKNLKKGLAEIQMGINGRSVWKLHFNLSFRSW